MVERRRPILWLGLILLSSACTSRGQLVVDVVTDFAPGIDFDAVEVTSSPLGARSMVIAPADVGAEPRRVADFADVPPGRYEIEVTLVSNDREVASQALIANVAGSLIVTAIITRGCAGIECGAAETCVRGSCAPVECIRGSEPTCPPPECDEDDDCASTSECSTGQCFEGSCVSTVARPCESGLVCTAGEGCVPIPSSGDAGGADAGTDAGVGSRAACCTAWCRDENRFGAATLPSEAYFASTPSCGSSTGCTCAIFTSITTTYTVVTGDVCDAHDFALDCPAAGCDGSQCPVVAIEGRWDPATNRCTCVGTAPDQPSQDVWDSECVENADSTPFIAACP